MNMFLTLAYLFFIGSTLGWVAELLYRRFLSGANPERKWINPGFCVGPYVPLYGSGLCILYLLASNRNRVYSRDTLLEKIWGYDYMGETRTIDVHIRNLRKKIEQDPDHPEHVKTVRGVGYKFV